MARQTALRRWAIVLGGVAVLATAGCSSGPPAPYPTDPDPCASYCLRWVPPVYRPTPKITPCGGRVVTQNVPVQKVVFKEVCRPGRYEEKCVPDQCRRFGAVQVEPAKTQWVKVECKDPCTSCEEDCFKPVRVPPKFKWCEKVETQKGFEYCAYTPTEYDIVPCSVRTCEKVSRYVPGGVKVCMTPELYAPGHWAWEKRYDCGGCKKCPSPPTCAPMDASCPPPDPCGCETAPPVRGDFRRCPGE